MIRARPSAGLLIALAAIALLAACGGGDDEGDGATTSPAGESAPGPPGGEERSDSGARRGDPARRGAGEAPADGRPGSAPAEGSDPPAAGFRDTSEATDIPAFGLEAGASERSGAQRVLAAYLGAAREGRWERACAHLAAMATAQLREIVVQLESAKSHSCAEALRLVTVPVAQEEDPYFGPAEVAALRIKRGGPAGEGAGFALFHGADGSDYWATMRREGGEWKVSSTLPTELK